MRVTLIRCSTLRSTMRGRSPRSSHWTSEIWCDYQADYTSGKKRCTQLGFHKTIRVSESNLICRLISNFGEKQWFSPNSFFSPFPVTRIFFTAIFQHLFELNVILNLNDSNWAASTLIHLETKTNTFVLPFADWDQKKKFRFGRGGRARQQGGYELR